MQLLISKCPTQLRLAGQSLSRPGCNRRTAGVGPARSRPAVKASGLGSQRTSLDDTFAAAEARMRRVIATVEASLGTLAARLLERALLSTLLLLQGVARLVQHVRLATLALQLHAERPMAAGAMVALAGAGSSSSSSMAPVKPVQQQVQQQAQQQEPEGSGAGTPFDVLASATSGAAETLRRTLTDATAGMESKWQALEQTAAASMAQLFDATHQSATELSESMSRSGGGAGQAAPNAWKTTSTQAVLDEEQRLRETVFAQVYAELLSKDASTLGYTSQ